MSEALRLFFSSQIHCKNSYLACELFVLHTAIFQPDFWLSFSNNPVYNLCNGELLSYIYIYMFI
jgi:hypothetical protein